MKQTTIGDTEMIGILIGIGLWAILSVIAIWWCYKNDRETTRDTSPTEGASPEGFVS